MFLWLQDSYCVTNPFKESYQRLSEMELMTGFSTTGRVAYISCRFRYSSGYSSRICTVRSRMRPFMAASFSMIIIGIGDSIKKELPNPGWFGSPDERLVQNLTLDYTSFSRLGIQ